MNRITTIKKYARYLMGRADFIGVDISRDAIKVFQIKKSGPCHDILGWNKQALPAGLIIKHEIKDIEKFGQFFELALEQAKGKIKTGSLVVSIPESKVFTRVISLPKMEEQEAHEAIKWEAEANLPVSIDEVYFDWQILPFTEKQMKVLVFACNKKIVDNYFMAFDRLGLEVEAFEPESVATGRCVIAQKETAPILLVDIGSDAISYAIYSEGYPVFTSSGTVTGNLITDTISKYFGITAEKAESYKVKVGLGESKADKEKMFLALGNSMNLLLKEMQKAITFFNDTLSTEGKQIKKVIITGGGSNIFGLIPYLKETIKLEIIQGNPWSNFNFKKVLPPLAKEEAEGFTTAIGSALRENL